MRIIQDLIHAVWVCWFDYSQWSKFLKLKMTACFFVFFFRAQTWSQITVYVASSFLSTAITKTSIPITGIISTACMCVSCYYVLLLPQVGVLCKAMCRTVHPHTFKQRHSFRESALPSKSVHKRHPSPLHYLNMLLFLKAKHSQTISLLDVTPTWHCFCNLLQRNKSCLV